VSGPPDGEIPVRVPIDLRLWQTDRHVTWISSMNVFRSGCSIELVCHRRDPGDTGVRELDLARDLRLSIVWPDASRSRASHRPGGGTPVPNGPRLTEGGASAHDGKLRRHYWLSELPSTKTMTFVASWPSEGIGEHQAEFDAELVQAAAKRSRTMWTEPDTDTEHNPGPHQ